MSCSILATWPYGSSLMKACKKQKLDKPGQQSIGGSKKDSSIFKLPEMLKSCSVLGYSDYVLARSNISAIHVDTVRRCNGKRTIACNLWNSYSSWCFLRRIHWKTPKRRRMHQSRSRRWDHVTKYFDVFCISSTTQSRNHVKQCSQFCIPGGGASICSVEIILFRGSRARLRILWIQWMHSNASNIE